MPNYEEYTSMCLVALDIHDANKKIGDVARQAEKDGWTKLYIDGLDDGWIAIMGVKPPDLKAIAAAKEKRRKQFERLKKEFEGE